MTDAPKITPATPTQQATPQATPAAPTPAAAPVQAKPTVDAKS